MPDKFPWKTWSGRSLDMQHEARPLVGSDSPFLPTIVRFKHLVSSWIVGLLERRIPERIQLPLDDICMPFHLVNAIQSHGQGRSQVPG